jgi:hypothetical protein
MALTAGYFAARLLMSAAVANHFRNLPSDQRQWKDLLVRPFAGLAVPLRTDMETLMFNVVVLAVLALIGIVLIRMINAARATGDFKGGRRVPASVCFGMSWIVLCALPLLRDFYVSPSLEGSRFLYLPCVGFVLILSAAFSRDRSRNIIAFVALACLAGIYGLRIAEERKIWLETTRLRDRVLAEAASIARTVPCRTLTVENAPDNHRGVYVFREGLEDALAEVRLIPGGENCQFRWTGSGLIPVSSELTSRGRTRNDASAGPHEVIPPGVLRSAGS